MDVKLCWTCSDSPRSLQTPPRARLSGCLAGRRHSRDGNFAAGMQKRPLRAQILCVCEKHPQLEPLNSFLMGLSRKRARVRLRPETKSLFTSSRLRAWEIETLLFAMKHPRAGAFD